MANFFLDPEGGNDANDGTTFANRKKTIAAFTAAILAPGDTVRIIASPDPASPGSATWTDNSGVITWAAAKNAIIDNCDTAWTAAANVTATALTTNRKEGTACAQFTPATAFTTGKMAYRATGTLDLSAYTGISFWFYASSELGAAGAAELRLCSDATGDTAVHTIPLEAGANGAWSVHTWDNGAALSSSIQSVALYATVDPGTTAVRLDNIVACKAPSSSDHVSHKCAIGKNTVGEPEWYSVLSIQADSVTIGGYRDIHIGTSSPINPRPYRGASETVATYVLQGINTPGESEANRTVQDSGTDGSPITYSGGWNRTDMSTQTGATYFQCRHYKGNALYLSLKSWVSFEKIGALYAVTAAIESANASDLIIDLEDSVGCIGGPYRGSSDTGSFALTFKSIHGAANSSVVFGSTTSGGGNSRSQMVARGLRIHGGTQVSSSGVALKVLSNFRYFIGRIDNNYSQGISNLDIIMGDAEIHGTTFKNNATDIGIVAGYGNIRLFGCTYTTTSMGSASPNTRIYSTRKGGVATAHETLARYFTLESDASVRHTASGIAWKLSPFSTTAVTQIAPASFPIAKFAVNASALVTVKCWLRRTNTGLSASIRLTPNDIAGDPLVVSETLMTAAADTWEEVTLTFTPTAAGVVQVEGCAWGGTTYSAYFDDITLTQA